MWYSLPTHKQIQSDKVIQSLSNKGLRTRPFPLRDSMSYLNNANMGHISNILLVMKVFPMLRIVHVRCLHLFLHCFVEGVGIICPMLLQSHSLTLCPHLQVRGPGVVPNLSVQCICHRYESIGLNAKRAVGQGLVHSWTYSKTLHIKKLFVP